MKDLQELINQWKKEAAEMYHQETKNSKTPFQRLRQCIDDAELLLQEMQISSVIAPPLQQAAVGRSKALELLGSVLDRVGEIKSCGLMHRTCVAFRTTDGKGYKLSLQPQDQVVLD